MNSSFTPNLYTVHAGQAGTLGSPEIWSEARRRFVSASGGQCAREVGDMFLNFGDAVVGAKTDTNGYHSYGDTGGTIKQRTDAAGGIALVTGGTDNFEQALGSPGAIGRISTTAGQEGIMLFEASLELASIADTQAQVFVGLVGPAFAGVADFIVDGGATFAATAPHIGFYVEDSDGDMLTFVYGEASETHVSIDLTGVTLAAATELKVGFICAPQAPAAKRLTIVVNNIVQPTALTSAQIEAAAFPDGTWLSFNTAIKTGAAAAKTLKLNWWNFYNDAS